jgi:hypothetical protein
MITAWGNINGRRQVHHGARCDLVNPVLVAQLPKSVFTPTPRVAIGLQSTGMVPTGSHQCCIGEILNPHRVTALGRTSIAQLT